MECIRCKTKNVNKANYCKNCGYHFSKEEQKAAKKWTLVWFLECFDKAKSILNLSIITDHILFKIASIVVVLGIGFYSFFTNGNSLKLLESNDYKVQYNTELSEYYLLANKEKTNLNLYIPNRAQKLIVEHIDQNNQLIDTKEYAKEEEIVFSSDSNNDYYILEAAYENNNFDKLKFYIYYVEEKEGK